MLQSMRDNSQGIIAKILVGLIIVVFALWGVDSLVGLATAEPPPAKVNGTEISKQELYRGVELQRRQILSQMGENADPALLDDNLLRKAVLDSLIDRTLQETAADAQGLFVSEEMLDQLIVTTADFQVEGRFDRNQFEATLRSAGFTPLSYRQLLRKMTLIEQQRRAYTDSAFVTQAELDRMLELNRQARDLRYTLIRTAPESIDISEADIKSAYDARASELMTPEQLIVDYVILERESFARPEAVSAAEINTAYENLKTDFQGREERLARHILLEVNDQQSADQALEKAKRLRQEIIDGADFAEVAKMHSEDVGSASMGGELGYLTPGLFVGAFDDTLFALEQGQVSEPVTSEFGIHLIRVEDIRRTEAPSLAEVESDLRDDIASQNAEREYVATLERLADLAFSSSSLVAINEELGLKIETSEPFASSAGEGIFANARVLRAVNSDTVRKEGLNSDLIELDSGRTLVLHLKEQIPARQRALDEVREELVAELKAQRAAEKAAAEAEELVKSLNSGKSVDVQWTVEQGVVRGGDTEISPAIVNTAFAMPRPTDKAYYRSIRLIDGSVAVVSVDSVGLADEVLAAEQRQQVARMLAGLKGEKAFNAYFDQLKQRAEIEIN